MDKENLALVNINNLGLTIENRKLLDSFMLKIPNGKRIGITGPSGCGKTTLLRSILKKTLPEHSSCDSFEISKKQFAYAPQKNGLFSWFSLRKNIELAVKFSQYLKPYTKLEIDELISRYGLTNVASSFPNQLSGGEYQRAILAVAVALRSDLLILDEPLTGADNKIKWKILEELSQDITRQKSSLLLVSHDVDTLLFLCDEIIVLKGEPAATVAKLTVPSKPTHRSKDITLNEFINIRKKLFDILLSN